VQSPLVVNPLCYQVPTGNVLNLHFSLTSISIECNYKH